MRLCGSAEVAEVLGVSRQRVNQLTKTRDFPQPLDRISAGAIWRREDIEAYAAQRDQAPTHGKTKSGQPITEEFVQEKVAQAEAGFEVPETEEEFLARRTRQIKGQGKTTPLARRLAKAEWKALHES